MKRTATKKTPQVEALVEIPIFPDEPPVQCKPLQLGAARPLECLLPPPTPLRRSRELANGSIEWFDDVASPDYAWQMNAWLAKAGSFVVYQWLCDNPDYQFTAQPEAHGVTLPLPANAIPSKMREVGNAWLSALRDELLAEGVRDESLIAYGLALCGTVANGPLSRIRV